MKALELRENHVPHYFDSYYGSKINLNKCSTKHQKGLYANSNTSMSKPIFLEVDGSSVSSAMLRCAVSALGIQSILKYSRPLVLLDHNLERTPDELKPLLGCFICDFLSKFYHHLRLFSSPPILRTVTVII